MKSKITKVTCHNWESSYFICDLEHRVQYVDSRAELSTGKGDEITNCQMRWT